MYERKKLAVKLNDVGILDYPHFPPSGRRRSCKSSIISKTRGKLSPRISRMSIFVWRNVSLAYLRGGPAKKRAKKRGKLREKNRNRCHYNLPQKRGEGSSLTKVSFSEWKKISQAEGVFKLVSNWKTEKEKRGGGVLHGMPMREVKTNRKNLSLSGEGGGFWASPRDCKLFRM